MANVVFMLQTIPLSFYAFTSFINFIATIILSFVIYLKNSKGTINRTFGGLSFSAAWWSFFYFLWLLSLKADTAEFYMRTCMIGVIFMPTLWFHFLIAYLRIPKHKTIIIINYGLSIAFSTTIYSNIYSTGVSSISVFPYWLIPGPIFHLALVHFAIIILYSIALMIATLKQSIGLKRNQIQYLLIASIIAYTAGSSNFLYWYRIPFPPVLNSFVSLYVLTLALSIKKYRFMDIRTAIVRSVVFTALLLAMAGTIALILLYISLIPNNIINKELSIAILTMIAAISFQPMRNYAERYTDRFLSKGRYDFNNLLTELGDIVERSMILDELAIRLLESLSGNMRLTKAILCVCDGEKYNVWTVGTKDGRKLKCNKILQILQHDERIISIEDFEEGSEGKALFRMLMIEVVVPLTTKDEMIGFLVLGERRAGNMFDAMDMKLLEIIAPETAIAIQHAKLFKQKEMRIKELDALSRLALNLGSTLDLDHILEMIIDEAIAITGAENSSIMLLDEENELLTIKAARGLKDEKFEDLKLKIGEGIAGWVAKTKKPALIIDGKHEDKYLVQCLKREDIRSSLTVPLKVKEKVIGVLSVNRKARKDVFTEESLGLINSCAAHAAQAIENARLYDNLEATFLGTISALVKAIDARDKYTYGHSEAVTVYAVAIAKKLDLSDREVRNIEIAGRLHDIGKIGIDDSILNKPDRLTEDEMNIIKQHPRIAVDILNSVEMLSDVIPYILYHHERYSGGGYPLGLSGTAIPLGARIIAVVDAFNAMVTNRPYMQARSIEKATDELNKCSGAQFDPMIVKVFIEVLRDEHNHLKDDRLLLDSEVPEKV